MAGIRRYDRDWPLRRRPTPGGGWYHREYDGAERRGRESGYDAVEFRRPRRATSPPLYTDDFRHRPAAAEREADTLWATPSHRRRREPRGPWERGWRPQRWWHAIGPEPRVDYDWAYEARRPERYGWTGETGRG